MLLLLQISFQMPPPLPEIPPPPIPAEIMDLPSPEDGMSSPGVEVFDLPEDSSSDGVTPEMDAQVLFIKLKEVSRHGGGGGVEGGMGGGG